MVLSLRQKDQEERFSYYLDWLIELPYDRFLYFYPKVPVDIYDKIEELKELSIKKEYSKNFSNTLRRCKEISKRFHGKRNKPSIKGIKKFGSK